MNYTQEEIATMVAQKCQEVLAPLYEELHELQTHYGLRKAEQPTIDPTPTQEEFEDAEFMKQLQEMKEMLVKSGRIPRETKKNN